MLKYFDFINKNLIYNLTLESKIQFSENFLIVLKSTNNPIAKTLLKIQNKDYDIQYNFIDSNLNEIDMVSFIPDKRAQDLIGSSPLLYKVEDPGRHLTHNDSNNELFKRLGYDKTEYPDGPHEVSYGIIGQVTAETTSATSGKVYVLFQYTDEDGRVQKACINKTAIIAENEGLKKVWTTSRNKIKVGRLVRTILQASKIPFKDIDIEQFTND